MRQSNQSMTTEVKSVEVDNMDDIFSYPGTTAITPSTTQRPEKNLFLSRDAPLDFLDQSETDDVVSDSADDQTESVEGSGAANIVDQLVEESQPGAEEEAKPSGRPRNEKNGLVAFYKKQIESGAMEPFDDFDESKETLDQYLLGLSQKDLDELWEVNQSAASTKLRDRITAEFLDSLPHELTYAAKYALDGGTDMKGLFRALSQMEENRELNVDNEGDQLEIMRQYLTATKFGDSDEVEDQLNEWKDLNVLGEKAKRFKPKLDQMQEEVLQMKLREQEQYKLQQKEARENYINNVFIALKTGELSGLKLDRATQNALYTGLTQTGYKSLSGRPTNQLGHLLEKYQTGKEANYGLIAEALWLLSNPETYKASIREQGAKEQKETTVRQLKGEQQRRKASAVTEEAAEPTTRQTPGIKRPNHFFRR